MLKITKTICLFVCLFVFCFQTIVCDGNQWIREEESPLEVTPESDLSSLAQSVSDEGSTTVSNTYETETETGQSSNQTEGQPINGSETSEAVPTSTEKPPPKKFGCTTRLWTGGQKLCWTLCDTSSTSSFWNTWCFTTNATISDSEQAQYMECDTDDICRPDWKCKSSCGMFSPHWDRDGNTTALNENIPSFDGNQH